MAVSEYTRSESCKGEKEKGVFRRKIGGPRNLCDVSSKAFGKLKALEVSASEVRYWLAPGEPPVEKTASAGAFRGGAVGACRFFRQAGV